MFPQEIEIVLIHLIFDESDGEMSSLIHRNHIKPSKFLFEKAKYWFLSSVSQQNNLIKAGEPKNYRFNEWRINSGDKDLFTNKDSSYDEMLIFIGTDNLYYKFNKGKSAIDGSLKVDFSYCGCCIYQQYPRILEYITSHI